MKMTVTTPYIDHVGVEVRVRPTIRIFESVVVASLLRVRRPFADPRCRSHAYNLTQYDTVPAVHTFAFFSFQLCTKVSGDKLTAFKHSCVR